MIFFAPAMVRARDEYQIQSSASCLVGSEEAGWTRTTSGLCWWRKQSLVTNQIVGVRISAVGPCCCVQILLQSAASVSRERSGMVNSSWHSDARPTLNGFSYPAGSRTRIQPLVTRSTRSACLAGTGTWR